MTSSDALFERGLQCGTYWRAIHQSSGTRLLRKERLLRLADEESYNDFVHEFGRLPDEPAYTAGFVVGYTATRIVLNEEQAVPKDAPLGELLRWSDALLKERKRPLWRRILGRD